MGVSPISKNNWIMIMNYDLLLIKINYVGFKNPKYFESIHWGRVFCVCGELLSHEQCFITVSNNMNTIFL